MKVTLLIPLTAVVLYYGGRHFHVNAYKSLKHWSFTMDVLVSIATNLAFAF